MERPCVPRLMFVTDARRARLPLLDLAAEAVAGGVDAIYLRDIVVYHRARGSGSASELQGRREMHLQASPLRVEPGHHPAISAHLSELVDAVRERVGEDVALLVNGDPETAHAMGCGLHLRERDMPAAKARELLGSEPPIGRSVHSVTGAVAAVGADYVLAGHVYPSASKPGQPPLGLDGLAAIVRAAPCPVLAIGGITAERVPEVVRAGACGVAVIGAIAEASDPRAAATSLRAALDRAQPHATRESFMNESTSAASAGPAIEIVVNGKTTLVPAAATVHDFLTGKRMTDAMAIVERNGAIVSRADYGTTVLEGGDRLEVVHAVGGG